ncbi:spore coat U domain-containing protein [Tsuneonella mangrovi]|uniref:Csu type fimbrial protein n=1 Tax=Tsuneonella mangrovi TaxID=1982042 RepID=UPI0012373152|nr:spore coat U domain-containing protein [Tsuneonella mangrovi]
MKIAVFPAFAACLAAANPAYAGQTTNSVPATLKVNTSCGIKTNPLMFGNSKPNIKQIDASSTIDVTCNPGTAYTVSIDDGQNATAAGQRRMLAQTAVNLKFIYVSYDIYQDAARTQRWGATPGSLESGTIPPSGTVTHTLYGRVPAGKALPTVYLDTVTITLSF